MVFNYLIFLRPNFVLGTLFYSEISEVGHLPIHLVLKSQIPLFLWACSNIISFQVQLVLEWWLILSWYSLRLCATKYFIFNQNVQVSVLGFFFVTIWLWLRKFYFPIGKLTDWKAIHKYAFCPKKGNKQTHRNSSSCQKRNTEVRIQKSGSRFRFCH